MEYFWQWTQKLNKLSNKNNRLQANKNVHSWTNSARIQKYLAFLSYWKYYAEYIFLKAEVSIDKTLFEMGIESA